MIRTFAASIGAATMMGCASLQPPAAPAPIPLGIFCETGTEIVVRCSVKGGVTQECAPDPAALKRKPKDLVASLKDMSNGFIGKKVGNLKKAAFMGCIAAPF